MSIEQAISEAVVGAVTGQTAGLIEAMKGRDALLTETLSKQDVLSDKLDTLIASQKALLDAIRSLTSQPPVEPPAPPPAVPPPPPTEPPGDPIGSVRWDGSLWTISTDGKRQILRDGVVTPETALTKDVKFIWKDEVSFFQANTSGDVYKYSGSPHWTKVDNVIRPVSGSIQS